MKRSHGLPLGFLATVGLVIAIEVASCHFGSIDICRSQLRLSWRKTSQAVAGPEAKAQILCFGDSMVKLGVLPPVIEDCLGLSAYNLAVLAGQPASSFILFRRALESGQRPRAVIVDFSAPLLTVSLQTNTECWGEIANCRDAIELATLAGDPALGMAVISRWLIPSSSRHRHYRASLPEGVDSDSTQAAVEDTHAFVRNWRLNRGAQVAPRQFVPIAGALREPPRIGYYRWRPRAVHTAYVARFLSLARSYAIPVFWVLPPVVGARRERLDACGITSAYETFVASFLRAYPEVTILDGQRLGWDTKAFRDPIHLNRDGAVAFTLAIARTLAPRLGSPSTAANSTSELSSTRSRVDERLSPRWAILSAPDEITSHRWEQVLEDLDQSRRALSRQGEDAAS